jgi:opacity protein-like surface antigen
MLMLNLIREIRAARPRNELAPQRNYMRAASPKLAIRIALAAVVTCCVTAQAADLPPKPTPLPPAPTLAPSSAWQFEVTAPLWASAIDGTVGVGQLPSAGVHATFIDMLKKLQGVLPGTFVAHNDTFIVGLDFQWARVGADATFKVSGGGPFANLRSGSSASFQQDQTFATAFAGYRIPIGAPDVSLYGTIGARYQYLGAKVDLSQQFPGYMPGSQPAGFTLVSSQSRNWIDPLVGFVLNYRINEKWFINTYGDIGGFGVASTLTSMGVVELGYNVTSSISTELGYKALYTDYQHGNGSGGSFRYETTMHGPLAGLTYHF